MNISDEVSEDGEDAPDTGSGVVVVAGPVTDIDLASGVTLDPRRRIVMPPPRVELISSMELGSILLEAGEFGKLLIDEDDAVDMDDDELKLFLLVELSFCLTLWPLSLSVCVILLGLLTLVKAGLSNAKKKIQLICIDI